ncbi:MAG: hypothetical protein U1E13_11595 [Methylophilaceae bacterium]|uniref:hypothetical protein n=1 Tax=Methylicorpusculum sp. TaxID=2713644 RepID=UPI002730AA68|nr:hypothetical protein [Methylicorpusculum sp.]MDP2178383.1 hypothetical protein [Methylicorpusculum sp.]MDP3530783.1 hypothetical protein [Methylicorpusculum sp.]MDZ4099321.1 hypothetical protein [Methylophilaceae bacterium]
MKFISKTFVLSVAAFVPLLTVFYALDVMNGIPLGDEWRWIKNLLLPYVDGKIGFWNYLTGEYSFLGHTHFLTLMALLVNYQFFSLDLVYLAYFGLVFYVLGWLLLLMYLFRYQSDKSWYTMLSIALITVAYFSITTDFPWLLVSFEYFYYFFALAILVLADGFLCKRISFTWLCVATFFSALFLDSFGVVAVLAIILVLSLNNLVERRKIFQPILLLAIFFSTWILLKIAIGDGINTSSSSRFNTLALLLGKPGDIFESLLISFSQPLLDKAVLQYFFPFFYRTAQMIVGAAGLVLVAISLVGYGRNFNDSKSRLPFLLAGYASVAWVLILLTRYSDFGAGIFDAQRFTRFFVLYYVAAAFAFLKWRAMPKVFALFAILLLGSYAISANYQYSNVASVHQYFEGAGNALREVNLQDGNLNKYIGKCSDRYCDETIYSLREKGIPFVQANH